MAVLSVLPPSPARTPPAALGLSPPPFSAQRAPGGPGGPVLLLESQVVRWGFLNERSACTSACSYQRVWLRWLVYGRILSTRAQISGWVLHKSNSWREGASVTQSGNSCGQAGTGFAVVKTKNLGHADSGTATPLKPCPLPRSLTNPILFSSHLPAGLQSSTAGCGQCWWGKARDQSRCPAHS